VIEKVKWRGKTLALILRSGFDNDGVNFVTDQESPLQVGVLRHPQGFKIRPHMHKPSEKTIDSIQEVLHVEYGRVGVNFYSDSGEQIGSAVIDMGDTILLISGGHGFDILEDAKMIEVKQGPYEGVERDKRLLETGGD
jgi:hypothetical protein